MTNTFCNFGQIFHADVLYYSVETEGEPHFISSNKEKLTLEDLKAKGIRFPALTQNHEAPSYSCLKNGPWSSESIKLFLKSKKGERTVDPKELVLSIKNAIKKVPHPEDKKELLVLILFPFLTGLYTVFQTIPYISLAGDPYLIQVLCKLMEKISFNGIHVNSPNGSLISRLISLYGSTLIITMPDDHSGNYPLNNILTILDEGVSSSGAFIVLNERSLPSLLPTYSPKILDLGLKVNHLKNPPIEIQVNKQPDSPFYLHISKTEAELQKIRDDLHICCLESARDIFKIYQDLKSIPEIPNQYMESFSGIFSIAKHLDSFLDVPFLFNIMVCWAKDTALKVRHNRNFDVVNEHIIYLAAEFMERFGPNTDGYYVAEQIANYVTVAGDFSKKLRPEDLTRRLKPFIEHRKRDWIDVERTEDQRKRTKIKVYREKISKHVNA